MDFTVEAEIREDWIERKKEERTFFSSRRIVDFDRRVEGRELEKKTIKNVLMPFDH